MSNPFIVYPGLVERAPHLVHMYLRDDPMVLGYQFWGSQSISDAYGNPAGSGVGGLGPTTFFQVPRGQTYKSPRILRRGAGAFPENRKGTTHVFFDPTDFELGGQSQPLDSVLFVVRVQERRNGGLLVLDADPTDPVLGPLYLIPNSVMVGTPNPSFTTQSVAPSSTGCVAGSPPVYDEDLSSSDPRPLHLVFPYPLREFCLKNLDAAKDMLVSFGPGQAMQTILPGMKVELFSGRTKEMVLACPEAGGCAFSLHGAMTQT